MARDGAIVWEQAFGFADRERGTRATATTPYAIASVSKTFTATELMVLANRASISLNQSVNHYLAALPARVRVKSFAWNADEVTIDRLAHHTAGLTTHAVLCFRGTLRCNTSPEDAVADYAIAIRLPGERFDYSNLGYGLLGMVVEQVTHRSLGSALRRDVFLPLGLNDTFIGASNVSRAVAASYAAKSVRADGYRSSTPGASNGYSSAHDLATFGMFALGERRGTSAAVLPDSLIVRMQQQTVRAGPGLRYGFGWWLADDYYGQPEVYAAGGTSVASATLALLPKERLAVAIVTNTGLPLADITDDVIAAFIPDIAKRRTAAANAKANIANRNPVQVPPAFVGNWDGIIAMPHDSVRFTMSIDSAGAVRSSVGGSPIASMTEVSFSVDGRMFSAMKGTVSDTVFRGRAYHLSTELAVHGARVTGYVTAEVDPGPAEGIALSYWVDLRKR